jgi:transcriptional regulator with AAA-type ATPase domain
VEAKETVSPKSEESTRQSAARGLRELRVVVFWDGGSASHPLLPGAELSVGRSDECDIVVADDSVSRRHAVVRGGPPPTIEDLGSANGTSVADQTLAAWAPAALLPSTVVELGDALLVVRHQEAAPPSPPSEAPPRFDPPMARVHELVALVAPSALPVILLGETGVGKGVMADAIHRASSHAAGPFVRVNCAAFAETLLESELFGHERGAFTGAVQAKAGLLEAASGGTLLLDEVGDMPPSTQAKLLHALEHKEVLRVGALRPRPVDVRFIAATNRDLNAWVHDGRFRQDLFFRLSGVTLTIPPLRERPSEIPALARRFVREACAQMGRPPAGITEAAETLLARYEWPGNVRELRSAMLRAALFAQGERIGVEHFEIAAAGPSAPVAGALRGEVRELERRRIVEALARSGGNLSGAARSLGIARGTLRSRMRELDVAPVAGKSAPSDRRSGG